MTSPRLKSYFAVIERDGAGGWMGHVPDVPGCHIRASTLRGARQQLPAVLAGMVGAPETPMLIDLIRLPEVPSEPSPRRRRARKAAEARRLDAEAAYAEFGQGVGVSGQAVREVVRRTCRRLERLSCGDPE